MGAPPRRLTALDQAFLAFEHGGLPTHIGSVLTLEGAPLRDESGSIRIDDVRRAVVGKLDQVPHLRQRLSTVPLGLGLPSWEDDPHFEIADHVKLAAVPSPGDTAALLALGAELHSQTMDRRHPLWELWIVDGLADGRVGLVEKIHHALADGVSGVELATILFDTEPDAPLAEPSPWTPAPTTGPVARATSAVRAAVGERVRRPWRAPGSTLRELAALARKEPGFAPRSTLNAHVGPRRRIDAVKLSLEDLRRAGHDAGGHVNDAVVAIVGGGLRALLTARHDLPVGEATRLHALVPVSLHGEGTGGDLGNLVAGLVVPIPVGIADDHERLREVAQTIANSRASGEAEASARLLHSLDRFPAPITAALAGLVNRQPFVNVVITNVPGTPFPLYVRGARLLDVVPVVPLGGNLSLAVGALSYLDALTLGLTSDPDVCVDLDAMVEGIRSSAEALGVAVLPEAR